MDRCNIQNIHEINRRFALSWKQLSAIVNRNKLQENPPDPEMAQLKHCLKWCVAYAMLHSYCKQIIDPYCDHPSLVIKRFWVTYWEQNVTGRPPTAKDFFEWYCDSSTIRQEQSVRVTII